MMFAPKEASAQYSGNPNQDFSQMEKIIKVTLAANAINLVTLSDAKHLDYPAMNAKAILIIYSLVTGAARTHHLYPEDGFLQLPSHGCR